MPKHAASETCTSARFSISLSLTSKHESLFMHGSMCPEHTDAWQSLEPSCLICKQFGTVGSYLHSFEGYARWDWLHAFQTHGLILTLLFLVNDKGYYIRRGLHQYESDLVYWNLFIICQTGKQVGCKVTQTRCTGIWFAWTYFFCLVIIFFSFLFIVLTKYCKK